MSKKINNRKLNLSRNAGKSRHTRRKDNSLDIPPSSPKPNRRSHHARE